MDPISPSRHGGSFNFALSKQLLGLAVQHCCIFPYIPYRCGAGEEFEQIKINDMWRAYGNCPERSVGVSSEIHSRHPCLENGGSISHRDAYRPSRPALVVRTRAVSSSIPNIGQHSPILTTVARIVPENLSNILTSKLQKNGWVGKK